MHLGYPAVNEMTAFPGGSNDMNQRDGFTSGFVVGTFVGGIVGGVIGALVVGRVNVIAPDSNDADQKLNAKLPDAQNSKGKRRQFRTASEVSIEAARRSLEDKIAQLNETIDEVRLTLGNVNRNLPEEDPEQSFPVEHP